MAARGENQSDLLRGSGLWRNRARHLIGKSLHNERMCCIHVIMMDHYFRMRTTSLDDRISQCLALNQVKIERRRKDEDFSRSSAVHRGVQPIDRS